MASMRQPLGEGRDVQRHRHPAAHGEHVAAGVGGGDGAEVGRVVDERREEVGGGHDGQVVADPVDGGVVERGQADQQRVVGARRPAPGPARTAARRPTWPHSHRTRSTRSGAGRPGHPRRARRRAYGSPPDGVEEAARARGRWSGPPTRRPRWSGTRRSSRRPAASVVSRSPECQHVGVVPAPGAASGLGVGAQRGPHAGHLVAAIDTPVPVQQHTTPRSAAPVATASPTCRPTSGQASPSPTTTTSWPASARRSCIRSVSAVRSSVPKAILTARTVLAGPGRLDRATLVPWTSSPSIATSTRAHDAGPPSPTWVPGGRCWPMAAPGPPAFEALLGEQVAILAHALHEPVGDDATRCRPSAASVARPSDAVGRGRPRPGARPRSVAPARRSGRPPSCGPPVPCRRRRRASWPRSASATAGVPKRPVQRGADRARRRWSATVSGPPAPRPAVAGACALWSAEVIDAFAADGHPIDYGACGENLTVRGLPWAEVRPGVRLAVGSVLVEASLFALPVPEQRAVVLRPGLRAGCTTSGDRSAASTPPSLEGGEVRAGDAVVLEP